MRSTIRSIDPVARRVNTDDGSFDTDILVVALGADVDPAETPGLLEGGHEFYTVGGAYAAADAIANFGGGRVVIGVASTPFKCPPAPSETALLMHHHLRTRGLLHTSHVTLAMPFGAPIPPSPDASAAILGAFADRGIAWHPGAAVLALDVDRRLARLSDGDELPYDLFLGVPVHVAPRVVVDAGLTVDGWIPVDSLSLRTRFSDVYAIGDVTSVGTPKAGVFAEGQGAVVAARISARLRGGVSELSYDGRGVCYLEFGDDMLATVDVTFVSGQAPVGVMTGPSPQLAADKRAFGAQRTSRWFDRDWQPVESRRNG